MVSATLAVTPKTLHYPFFYCHCIINFTWKPRSLLALGGSPHLMCTTCTVLLRCNNWGNSLQVWVFSHSFDNKLQHSVSKGYELQDLILICNLKPFKKLASIIRFLVSSGNGSVNINQIRTKCIWTVTFSKQKTSKPNPWICWRS